MTISDIKRQVRMVLDINKCLGCHTCTMACKTIWTDRNQGQMYMYWNNTETQPGKGYPKEWRVLGKNAGFPKGDCNDLTPDNNFCEYKVDLSNPLMPINSDWGAPWEYNYEKVLKTGKGSALASMEVSSQEEEKERKEEEEEDRKEQEEEDREEEEKKKKEKHGNASASMIVPSPDPHKHKYASNWDEDVGDGTFPNAFYFYLSRICNHCTKPACLAACPRHAIYKRAEDGIVLIDQDRCRGYRYCVKGCPYKKPMYNPEQKISQKCIFCYPRTEKEMGTFCTTQCVGRIRYIGYYYPEDKGKAFNDPTNRNARYNVNKLVDKYKVAMRLHPEFGTEPNVFYIPPLSPLVLSSKGGLGNEMRIPIPLLAEMFGDYHSQSMTERKARIEEIFNKLKTAREQYPSGEYKELVDILVARREEERIQMKPWKLS